ncbi:MAG: LrgB family protein [Fimbriimonas sp.]|nr:LrgB family protein [Fimbriimonas sp.]
MIQPELGVATLWSVVTIALYVLAKYIYFRFRRWWLAPLIVTPLVLMGLTVLSHTDCNVYLGSTHWLVVMLGPATVAFALPIYRRRDMICRYWRTLTIGVVFGSMLSMLTAWGFATLLGLDGTLRLSLLPRSISTPFAMTFSGQVGGVPELTAVFVILTGIWGAAFGEMALAKFPIKSTLARGSAFGLGAHAIGSNKAYQIDPELGAISAMVMVLTGVFNVIIAPIVERIVR